MTEGNNPTEGNADSTSAYSVDTGAERLARLFEQESGAIPAILESKDQDEPEAEQAEGDADEPETDEPEGEGTEEADKEEESEAEEGETISLSDETEIDLGDGTRTTLADLKASRKQVVEFQRDYTRKTQAIADDRRTVEEKAQALVDRVQQLQAERETFLSVVQEFLPQPPKPPTVQPGEDPIAWVEYQAQKEQYEQRIGKLNEVHQQRIAAQQQAEAERAKEMPKIVEQERAKLLDRFPKLKDPEVAKKTKTEMVDVFQREYGLTAEEVANVADSRVVAVMLDALEYRKLKAAAPAAKAKVEAKPPLVKAAKRPSPEAAKAKERQAMHDRLGKTGSRMDAVAILKALDL
jgi:hypothetical protein